MFEWMATLLIVIDLFAFGIILWIAALVIGAKINDWLRRR